MSRSGFLPSANARQRWLLVNGSYEMLHRTECFSDWLWRWQDGTQARTASLRVHFSSCTGKSNYFPVHAMKAYRRRRSKAPLIPNPFLLFPNAWIYSKPTSETEFFSFFHGTSARFRSMAFPLTFLQPSLFFSAAFQIRIWNKSTSYLQTACSHLSLGHGSLARGPPCCITRPAATFVILCVV